VRNFIFSLANFAFSSSADRRWHVFLYRFWMFCHDDYQYKGNDHDTRIARCRRFLNCDIGESLRASGCFVFGVDFSHNQSIWKIDKGFGGTTIGWANDLFIECMNWLWWSKETLVVVLDGLSKSFTKAEGVPRKTLLCYSYRYSRSSEEVSKLKVCTYFQCFTPY